MKSSKGYQSMDDSSTLMTWESFKNNPVHFQVPPSDYAQHVILSFHKNSSDVLNNSETNIVFIRDTDLASSFKRVDYVDELDEEAEKLVNKLFRYNYDPEDSPEITIQKLLKGLSVLMYGFLDKEGCEDDIGFIVKIIGTVINLVLDKHSHQYLVIRKELDGTDWILYLEGLWTISPTMN